MDWYQMANDLVEVFLNDQLDSNFDQITLYCQKNDSQLSDQFCNSFRTLFLKGQKLQEQGRLGEVAYMAISVLRTFIMEGCYQLRLDLYDKDYFLSKEECSSYLDLEYIFKYISSDIDALISELKECGAKFTTFEIDQFKKEHINSYAVLVQDYITQNLQAILGLKEFDLLQKNADFKILYGEYLDRAVVIYDAGIESEEV